MQRRHTILLAAAVVSYMLSICFGLSGFQFGFELFNPLTLFLIYALTTSIILMLPTFQFSAFFIAVGMFFLGIGEFLHFFSHYILHDEPYTDFIRIIMLIPTICLALNETAYYADKLKNRKREFSALLVSSFCVAAIGGMMIYKLYIATAGAPENLPDYFFLAIIFIAFYTVMMCLQTFFLIGWKMVWKGTNILTFGILFYEITDIWYVFVASIGKTPDNNILDLLYTFEMLMMPVGMLIQLKKKYVFPVRKPDYSIRATMIRVAGTAGLMSLALGLNLVGFFSNLEVMNIFIALIAYLVMSYLLSSSELDEARVSRLAAEEASKAKGDFLANMSHEIRT
ncbi:MAG: hypothetical protein IJ679_08410, partial [Lachnospiraceae bacterium]|nr:hypothetical protein [Lachnospiraceae bacterium]